MKKLLSQKAFVKRVAKVTADAGYTVETIKGTHLHVRLGDERSKLNLARAYNAYVDSPDRLDDIVQVHLTVLESTAKISVPMQPDGSEMLLPLLQQKSWLDNVTKKVKSTPVHQPFVTGLIVTYVIDAPTYRTYLNEETQAKILAEGSVTQEDIHQSALQNLRTNMAESMEVQVHNSFAETIIICETREGYASSLILLPDVMEAWGKKIPGNMLIGIPNRDFIIAFSDQYPAGIEGIEEQTHHDAQTRERPLSGRLLVWKEGRIRELKPLN